MSLALIGCCSRNPCNVPFATASILNSNYAAGRGALCSIDLYAIPMRMLTHAQNVFSGLPAYISSHVGTDLQTVNT